MSAANEITVEALLSGESEATAPADSPVDVQAAPPDLALPDQELEPLATDGAGTPPSRIIHFVHDGFTTLGRVWESGEELVITPEVYEATIDIKGNSILDLNESEQVVRWGKIIWHEGGVPEAEYAEAFAQREANLAEQTRRPPVLLAPVSSLS